MTNVGMDRLQYIKKSFRRRLHTDSFDTTTEDECDEDEEDLTVPFATAYMNVLPDDEEDRSNSCNVDHNKLESNSCGTSLALHEGGVFGSRDELNKHTFFYQPNIRKKKKRKKERFGRRIQEDSMHGKELE
eukprot:261450_1